MSEMIQFARPDGAQAPGYLARPSKPGAPGVVVIQEWWGLNPQIRGMADRFAAAGYRALVPDLYRGRQAADADEATHMMNGLDWPDALHQDLRGAVQYLAHDDSAVAVLGFCMGGALTLAAGVHVPEATAAVCFYGIPPAELADPAQIKTPLLCHFAQNDDWCTPDRVAELETTLTAAGVDFALHRYPAQHAFLNEARPEVYDQQQARLAWDRTLAFLSERLG